MASRKAKETPGVMRRHGDIVLQALTAEQAAEIASAVQAEKTKEKKYDSSVLAYGEVTGHAHRVAVRSAEITKLENGLQLLEVPTKAPLSHEEHKTFNLPQGFFAFTQKRQYNAENEMGWEAVQD